MKRWDTATLRHWRAQEATTACRQKPFGLAGIRSVMRAISALGGVVSITNVSSTSPPFVHCSQITAMAIGSPSFG